MVNLTVTFKPFQSLVALQMSSPIFLGDRPRGPTLGAKKRWEQLHHRRLGGRRR